MRLFNSTCDIETLKRQASTLNNNALKHFVTFLTLRVRKLQSIIEVMRKLTATGSSPERLIQLIISSMVDVVSAQNATVYIFNDRTNEIISKASTWLPTNSKCAIQKIFGGTQLLRGEAINVFNVKATENYDQKMEEHYKKVELECICAAPILADGSNRVVGFIEIINKKEGHPYFSAEDEFVIKCFASLVTLLSRSLHLGGSVTQSLDMVDSSAKKMDDIKSFISRASALGQEMEFEELISVITDALRDIVDAEFCNVFMADNEKREYTLVKLNSTFSGNAKSSNSPSKIPFAKGLLGLSGKNGQVINVQDRTFAFSHINTLKME
jgi:adenylate cyclase